MLEKVVFIAHSYHKKTKSYDFIVDYLKKFYELELIFDEEWETGKKIDWSAFDDKYKAVIIFQMFPENKEVFNKIKNENIVYLPMFDHVKRWHFSQWLLCRNVKVVSFSSFLHKKLKKCGFNSIYIQYFIEPKEFSGGAENEVFFWQRSTKININTIKKVFKNADVSIHLHKAVDPGQVFVPPSKKDEKHFKITYSEWFDKKKELNDFIKSKGIYIAPRFLEGIGMSFLEAMSQGKVVIANNQPTMNEYIEHGVTGFLCDYDRTKPIKLDNLRQIQLTTYNYAKEGYKKWLVERKNIIDFINEPPKKNELSLCSKLFLPFEFFDRKHLISFKLGSSPSLTVFGWKLLGK